MCIITLDYNQELFKELFYYDETSESGLRYKHGNTCKGPNRRFANDVAGSIRSNKVWIVKIKSKAYVVHRIIWYLTFGNIPSDLVIDHVDGNALNNVLSNMRLTTQLVNNSNHAMQLNNTSGKTGVYFRNNSWIAQWNVNGVQKTKNFKTFQEAAEYRDKMIKINHTYTERHGK